MNAVLIVIPILCILMFDLGLELDLKSFIALKNDKTSVSIGLLGQIVILPIVAFILALLFHLKPLYFIGVMLIACSPGGSSSNVFSMLAKGNVELSVMLTVLSSLITLITVPIIMNLTVAYVNGVSDGQVHLPVVRLILQNLVLMLLPIALGALLKYRRKIVAAKVHKVLKKCAFPLLLVLISIFFIQNRSVIFDNLGSLGVCITVLILVAIFCGVAFTYTFKIKGKNRRTIVIEIGMQNAAQAIAVASSPFIFNNDVIAIPAIVYALLMNVVLLGYLGIIKR